MRKPPNIKRHTKRRSYRTSVELSRAAVSHWSTASYGSIPVGHIHGYVQADGKGSVEVSSQVKPEPYALVTITTPGGKAPDGIHGGARRIDIGLTLASLEDLLDDLTNLRDELVEVQAGGHVRA